MSLNILMDEHQNLVVRPTGLDVIRYATPEGRSMIVGWTGTATISAACLAFALSIPTQPGALESFMRIAIFLAFVGTAVSLVEAGRAYFWAQDYITRSERWCKAFGDKVVRSSVQSIAWRNMDRLSSGDKVALDQRDCDRFVSLYHAN